MAGAEAYVVKTDLVCCESCSENGDYPACGAGVIAIPIKG
jgi:hypothetical protein